MVESVKLVGYEVNADNISSLLSDLGLLPAFIRRLLIRKHTAHILPSKEEQIEYQKSFFSIHSISDNESLKSWLSENGVLESEMSLHLFRSLQTEKLKHEKFSSMVQPYFLKHKTEFDLCSYSLIRTTSRASINELYIRLQEGEDTFSALSQEFSVGSESQSSGFISPKPFSNIHPEFAERLKISKPGQLWEPFNVDQYWCLLRLERIIPSSLDSKTFSSILDLLFDKWLANLVSEEINLIRTSTPDSFTAINFSQSSDAD